MTRSSIKHNSATLARTAWSTVLALITVLGFSGLAPALAHADNWQNLPVGSVISQSPMTLPEELQGLGTGKLVSYVSTDVNNVKVLVTGAIITPTSHTNPPRVVAYAHGTTGVADSCAPSTNLDVFWPEARAATKSYLEHGWTVAATDYQGLGGPGEHQYLVGNTEARAVIDSVRAARNMDGNLSNQYVVTGHSEGGQAALFAGEIANSYGTGLKLKGVVALAPVSNLGLLAQAAADLPGTQGYDAFILYGMKALNPNLNLADIFTQQALDAYPIVNTGCWGEVLDAYSNFTSQDMFVNGQLPQFYLDLLHQYEDPAQAPSTVPIYMAVGTEDPLFQFGFMDGLQAQECANNSKSVMQIFDGVDHDNIPIVSAPEAADFITARFAGQAAATDC